MQPEISEFSFGFALVSELVQQHGLSAFGAPEFATQNAEGQPGGGWDVHLPGLPVFLQIKRSECMVRLRGQERTFFPSHPIYRMRLHRRNHSDQHALLLALEQQGNVVYYVAPAFSLSEELNDRFISNAVAASSLFVHPLILGPLHDDDAHWVSFHGVSPVVVFCSEPKPIEVLNTETILRKELPRLALAAKQSTPTFGQLRDELQGVYRGRRGSKLLTIEMKRQADQMFADIAPTLAIAAVARLLFGCELLMYRANS